MASNCATCGYTNISFQFEFCPECNTKGVCEVKPAIKMEVGESGFLHHSSNIKKYIGDNEIQPFAIYLKEVKDGKYLVHYGSVFSTPSLKNHPYNRILDEWVDEEWMNSHMVFHHHYYNEGFNDPFRLYDYICPYTTKAKFHEFTVAKREYEETPVELYRFSELDDDTKAYVYSGKINIMTLIPGTIVRMIKNNYGECESDITLNGSPHKEHDGFLDNVLVSLTASGIYNSNFKLIDRDIVNGKKKSVSPIVKVYLKEDWVQQVTFGFNWGMGYSQENAERGAKISTAIKLLEEVGMIEHVSSGCGNSTYKICNGWVDVGLTNEQTNVFEQFEFTIGYDSKHSRKLTRNVFWSPMNPSNYKIEVKEFSGWSKGSGYSGWDNKAN
jgi:hypothetical protein